ncbi:hypothetical protein [uncultured Mucilaginibacter sp.]|uniref:hypothetical protein n=1 Tax=uncultured Mucilaginibacter sp. TaxID=797541 RepID=UPI00262864F5|nr:hypothetical protein [uncultured Mucilaginibacter sp.]
MTISTPIPKNVWFTALIASTILFGGLFLLQHVPLMKRDAVATALLADMVLTFPLAYYFLLIRPLQLRKWSMVFVFTCCCAVAYLTLPVHQKYYVLQLRKLSELIELSVILYAISKIRKIIAAFRESEAAFPDFAYNLYQSIATVLGNGTAIKLLASELIVLRFGLLCWKKPGKNPKAISRYTVYKESGYSALFGVLLFVLLIEIFAFHLLLVQYSRVAAIIVSLVSVYGMIFIISDLSATVKSPVLIMKDKLLLRVGYRWRTIVNTNNIASAEKINDNYQPDKNCFKGGITKNSVNVLLTFKHPVSVERSYRKPVTADKIIMSIDNVDDFIKDVEAV